MEAIVQEVTIYDIAKMAGVSPSTVSRIINNYPHVKKATRARVQKLLQEYHYIPNEAARGLVTQASRIIGILISDIRTTHHTDGVYYIEREFVRQGYCCLIFNTGRDEREQARYIQLLSQRKVEAAVLMGSIYQTDAVKNAIETYLPTTPVVICNGYLDLPNVYGLIADEQSGVFDCVKLLTTKGKKHLAYVVDHDTPSNRLKQQGFEAGVAKFCNGAAPIVIKTDETRSGAYEATQKLMQQYPETDGIIFAEDLLALIGTRALTDMRLQIPEQVSVIGINNSVFAENSIPTLTSLDNMLYDLSLTAARNIQAIQQGQRVNKKMMIFSKIIEREST